MESISEKKTGLAKGKEIHLQEQFTGQVEDSFTSAVQVLEEQKETRQEDGRTLLFVP